LPQILLSWQNFKSAKNMLETAVILPVNPTYEPIELQQKILSNEILTQNMAGHGLWRLGSKQ